MIEFFSILVGIALFSALYLWISDLHPYNWQKEMEENLTVFELFWTERG